MSARLDTPMASPYAFLLKPSMVYKSPMRVNVGPGGGLQVYTHVEPFHVGGLANPNAHSEAEGTGSQTGADQ
jgi:hypothetical protein